MTKKATKTTTKKPAQAASATKKKPAQTAKAKAPAPKKPAAQNVLRKSDQYDDPSYNYLHYWNGRDYENEAERMAIRRLLKGKHFKHATDIGGGYGRLCIFLEQYADKVTLAEPSQQQLDIAKDFLKGHPEIDRKLMQADDMKFKDGSIDLLTMIRVMHHLPNPATEFSEIARVLSDDGYAIIEVANYAHGRNRLKHFLKGSKLPTEPVDIRSAKNMRKDEIPFVNHNPHTVISQLGQAGLKIERVLSVSNLRSPGIKKIVPRGVMLAAESVLQPMLASSFFGPSVFFLVRKGK
ncbi:MAG TPA: class I SAM-dependent methyltransferase [Candidatus Saccharimonadales bacterium]|nr:class I SAM-dependent methyltransferase [Candidatus Saccharimonadales bacterium]